MQNQAQVALATQQVRHLPIIQKNDSLQGIHNWFEQVVNVQLRVNIEVRYLEIDRPGNGHGFWWPMRLRGPSNILPPFG